MARCLLPPLDEEAARALKGYMAAPMRKQFAESAVTQPSREAFLLHLKFQDSVPDNIRDGFLKREMYCGVDGDEAVQMSHTLFAFDTDCCRAT